MNKSISIALLVGGIIMIIYGISAAESLASDFSRFFTGSPTDKSIWFLICGVVAVSIGSFGVLRKSAPR